VADGEDLENPDLVGVGDAEGFRPAGRRQETVPLNERRDDGDRLTRRARSLKGEHLRLLDRHDLCRDTLDVRHVEFRALAARALGNRDLMLVDERVAGVEIGVGALHLRHLADDLAVVVQGAAAPRIVPAVVDQAPVNGRLRPRRMHPTRHDVDPAFAAGVGL
jgi:hypothetical protein